jgi:hypothetical protein
MPKRKTILNPLFSSKYDKLDDEYENIEDEDSDEEEFELDIKD